MIPENLPPGDLLVNAWPPSISKGQQRKPSAPGGTDANLVSNSSPRRAGLSGNLQHPLHTRTAVAHGQKLAVQTFERVRADKRSRRDRRHESARGRQENPGRPRADEHISLGYRSCAD